MQTTIYSSSGAVGTICSTEREVMEISGYHKRTQQNAFYKARLEASKHSDRLKSREGAAEALNLHPSTLANYELGTRSNPQPDVVVLMADLYNAPELLNYFCCNECPIGLETASEINLQGIDRIAIRALSSLQDTEEVKHRLIDIVADGKVTEDEEDDLRQVLDHLDQIAQTARELKLWVQKNL